MTIRAMGRVTGRVTAKAKTSKFTILPYDLTKYSSQNQFSNFCSWDSWKV